VSENLVEEWMDRYSSIASGNGRRLEMLQALFEALDRRGLAVLPLKGTDLLLRCYRGLGFRPMYDSDCLVRRKDLPAVRRLLEEKGFKLSRAPEKIWSMSFFNESFDYVSPDGEFTIDLQWTLWFLEDVESFWKRAGFHQTAIGKRRLIHPEDALLTQLVEVTGRRGWLSPFLPQDLEALLKAEGGRIDWTRWTSCVRALGLAPVIEYGLAWCVEKGLQGVPPAALENLRSRALPDRLRSTFLRRLVSKESAPKVQYALHAIALPDWKSRATMLRRVLWPAASWREERLGRPLQFLERAAFVTRPVRLFWRVLSIFPRELAKLLRN
jgi:hypothetical protein